MHEAWVNERLRRLPPVHRVMAAPALAATIAQFGYERILLTVQAVLTDWRQQIRQNEPDVPADDSEADDSGADGQGASDLSPGAGDSVPDALLASVCRQVAQRLNQSAEVRLRRVINATGVVLHTNLGRAPLAPAAVAAMRELTDGYVNLELNLSTGKRGLRYDPIVPLLRELTGAEDALVVNNNAAAVLLVLSALAPGREVIVSRGELVEIGGSFRIPDVMAQSGAQLVEVGATNKTRLSDYQRAITAQTAALMKVHPSNYRVVGFTASVAREDLVALARAYELPVIEDLGSGALLAYGSDHRFCGEPTVREAIQAGVDLVTFSGDKLLGGPQCGIILGRSAYLSQLASHPLMRALRVDKMTLAALQATLELYRVPEQAMGQIPALHFIARDAAAIAQQAESLALALRPVAKDMTVHVCPVESQIGGGAVPDSSLPSWALRIQPTRGVHLLAEQLRRGEPAVMGRVQDDALWLDLRTVSPEDDQRLRIALLNILPNFSTQNRDGQRRDDDDRANGNDGSTDPLDDDGQ